MGFTPPLPMGEQVSDPENMFCVDSCQVPTPARNRADVKVGKGFMMIESDWG